MEAFDKISKTSRLTVNFEKCDIFIARVSKSSKKNVLEKLGMPLRISPFR